MIVVKAGGRALLSNITGIANSIASRAKTLGGIVFVHGGGDLVSEYSSRLGIEPKFVTSPTGIRSRYTDLDELEVYVMVMCGKINKEVVSAINRFGANSVGISGIDGPTLLAERKKKIVIVDERGRKRVIEGGYTGQIVSVKTGLVSRLLEEGYVVVVAPVATGTEGEALNVDGDSAAAAIAVELRAERLLFLTDVEGVYYEDRLLGTLNPDQGLEIASKIGPGMNRKLMLAARAVKSGVASAIISNGTIPDPLSALDGSRGTLVR
ncbi:MAG: [LysW]-aminoadipate/[LysW]-glutamate kinase [Aigarchaeota archaeon]|nr:[LysW]-aminoadipate/[LysW]-glutamate kinase [Aigarchaeota archaeon]MDW8093316.1 [LysW]-aminoadipate/[LysW]-glutamate kinase [Nitrososphaerota archaeon]